MIEIPIKKVAASRVNPKKLLIFSQPKVGKTSALANLENNLVLDLENSADFYEGHVINVLREAKEHNISPLAVLKDVASQLKENCPFKYITIDTTSALEALVMDLAITTYRKTPMGKNYKGTDLRTLPNGAGYLYLREAFTKVYNTFDGIAECLILSAHVKDKSIDKKGTEISARDIDLAGKLKNITAADMDAIGYLYRKPNSNINILSFKSDLSDLASGARPAHLRDKEIELSELNPETNELTFNWEEIFLPEEK
jgi:hypothetical protein